VMDGVSFGSAVVCILGSSMPDTPQGVHGGQECSVSRAGSRGGGGGGGSGGANPPFQNNFKA
jgi:hypothetical protein